MPDNKLLTGYPSVDQPWLEYYSKDIPLPPNPNCSMLEFLKKCNQDSLQHFALNYFGNRITYRELFESIDRVASALYALGVKKGDYISVCPLNTPEFIYLFYAINKVGAVSNWIGLTSPISDIHEQLVSTGSHIVFTVSLAYKQIAEAAKNSKVVKIITIPIENSMPALMKFVVAIKNRNVNNDGIHWRDFIKNSGNKINPVDINPDEVAMIEYTGGSTGIPKGVMLSNKALNSYSVNIIDINNSGITKYRVHEKYLSGIPIFLAFGASACCHGPLCISLELILAPDPSPTAGTKIILKEKVNHIITGRLLIEELVAAAQKNKADLSFVQSIIYGGEETNKAWESSVTERLNNNNLRVPVLNGYGMTETSAAILIAPDNDTDGLIPFANVNVKIVNPDDETQEYSYDTEGELCVSADTLMNGYFMNERETKEVIFVENGKKWLKTRDLATISPSGIIKITGRIKRIYSRLTLDKIQIRVYPMRIEEALIKNSLVQACAVLGIKDDVLAYRSVAFIILVDKSGNKEDAKNQLKIFCCENLPDSHWPDEYVFLEQFPVTRAGKVDYRALEEMVKKQSI